MYKLYHANIKPLSEWLKSALKLIVCYYLMLECIMVLCLYIVMALIIAL